MFGWGVPCVHMACPEDRWCGDLGPVPGSAGASDGRAHGQCSDLNPSWIFFFLVSLYLYVLLKKNDHLASV